ncbi:iron-containing redox enzyme family protein [Streptomyces sp. HU2014]|uniref:iron-containing redox enzyme family protein n=1 Tax=Streptomyces sp. HU2014 TaxID=2939414 RepID=UPI00200FA9BF|nr:iron-containing redox enzyme family protein [Streptomyces sp. HU2014]UQI48778.1 iron-containing redox enzyme family protein [Streptomyces sp. HU2014]
MLTHKAASPAPSPPRRQDAGSASRTLYVRAADPECSLPGGRFPEEIRAELRRIPAGADGPATTPGPTGPDTTAERAGQPDLTGLTERAAAWADAERTRFRALLDGVTADGTRDTLVRRATLGCAPLALLSGAWLQWLSAPGNADDSAALRILTVYASDVGAGHPRASRGSAFLALLRQLLLSENAVPASRLALDQRIGDDAFHLPALLLAMSRRPDDFRAEILGADLCLRHAGLPPALALVREALPGGADWSLLDPGGAREEGGPADLERARAAVDALPAAEADRVVTGFTWALAALRTWSAGLYAQLDAARDPAYDMAELMRLRAREGSVYHHDFQVEGRSLSDWLKQARTDPGPLLDVLSRSRLVKPGRSKASPLVNGLVSERGPMFRVFSPEDLTVIRRWIDSLPAKGEERETAGPAAAETATTAAAPDFPSLAVRPAEGRAPADLREAYWMLQRRTDTPALRRWAVGYVQDWLARSRHGLDKAELQLPVRWHRAGLRPWLAEQHDRHGQEFEDGAEIPVASRAELVDSTVQLAPLTLIDGSWLQGFTDYENASSEIGFSLFETYWDELGNGEEKLNHPLIYREVLAEMDVVLPPTGSREFSRWSGFRDESFELPVYWLCVGRFPRTFLPEVLGLNVAMELSGVGGSYRRARIALKEHGFSTRFVDIHNTIDNVSTGHSAWAADAVDTFMATVPATRTTGGRAVVGGPEDVWERVRVGYRSLNPPRTFLARQVAPRMARTLGGLR